MTQRDIFMKRVCHYMLKVTWLFLPLDRAGLAISRFQSFCWAKLTSLLIRLHIDRQTWAWCPCFHITLSSKVNWHISQNYTKHTIPLTIQDSVWPLNADVTTDFVLHLPYILTFLVFKNSFFFLIMRAISPKSKSTADIETWPFRDMPQHVFVEDLFLYQLSQ